MADEATTETAIVTHAPAAAPVEKKTRAPRRSKVSTEATITAPTEKPVKKTRAKRGSKMAVAKAETPVVEAKTRATRKPRAKAADSVSVAPAGEIDDIAALIKLEEENLSLRKELSAMLRAENAELRKRLGKA
jgi:hypothetical protein